MNFQTHILSALFAALCIFQLNAEVFFQQATPIWPKGREKEKNLFVGFRSRFSGNQAKNAVLKMTGSSICRIFLNGKFLGYGPARGPHGWDRVDEWSLKGKCNAKENILAIEVAGYNVNSYYLLDEPAYLQAEVVADGKVLAATGGKDFEAQILPRIQKVPRFSFQRPFSEVYCLKPNWTNWRKGGEPFLPIPLATQPQQALLPRIAPYPDFKLNTACRPIQTGTFQTNPKRKLWRDRTITGVSQQFGGFRLEELTTIPIDKVCQYENTSMRPWKGNSSKMQLSSGHFVLLDWGLNDTGFMGAKIKCIQPGTLYFTFDEVLCNGDLNPTRMGTSSVVTWKITEPGIYDLEAFEPYTFRYMKIYSDQFAGSVEGPYIRTYKNSRTGKATFKADDQDLSKIFKAAKETFVQNSVDTFTDCPSRERAGWLCDSFFIGRVSSVLTGNTQMERLFFQNFQLPKQFQHIDPGMIPMCYPADHNNHNYIPNWSFWFILELDEYLARGGDREMIEALRPRVMGLLDFYRKYENSDGLLENLPAWVFVEWSFANKLTQDVNYPVNMTYAGALSSVARLYGLPRLEQKAEKIRATIRKQSFNGKWFVDNAVRQKDGTLKLSGESTETCQYYAFFFKTATPLSHPLLWTTLRDEFGPQRKIKNNYPKIHFSNAFIGNYLRLELLSREKLSEQILKETKGYFKKMADMTGTLWENDGPYASCCHGFASHVALMLYRDVLGIRQVDPIRKSIYIHLPNISLHRCEGSYPIGNDLLSVQWRKERDVIKYHVDAPGGYIVTVDSDLPKLAE